MSNLYKGSRIVNTSSVEHRIIDSNERILSRLEAIKAEDVSVNVEASQTALGDSAGEQPETVC